MKSATFIFVSFFICAPVLAEMDEYSNSTLLNIETQTYIDDTNIEWFRFSSGYYSLDENTKNNASGLNPGDWRAFYKQETEVLGTSTCNTSTSADLFTAAQKNGANCWCKIIATTSDVGKSTPTKWIYRGEFRDVSECANLCTYRCSYNFLADPDFRGEIFNK